MYMLFLVGPIFYGIYLSLFDWDILGTKTFIGFKNYIEAFGDAKFLSSFWHTIEFVLISVPVLMILGFVMALITVKATKLGKIAETAFFLPYMFSSTVVGTLWAWILQSQYGLVNGIIRLCGGESVGWLTDPRYAMLSITVATVWWTAGFNMILFSAGMKQIPDEIYESARLDGASQWTTLTKITLPLLKDTTVLVLILQVISSFKIFGQPYVMTGGGPYGRTKVLVQYMYDTAFNYFRMGYASAMSMLLFVVILIISVVQYVVTNKDNTK